MIFMGACSDSKEAPPAAEVESGGVELLSGYPEDILPLYESKKIEDTTFVVRDDANYVLGKDIYTVTYISSAPTKDIMTYYSGLTTSIDEESSGDDRLEAKIGENPLGVNISERENGLDGN